jgi:rod shape-determining protein MreD
MRDVAPALLRAVRPAAGAPSYIEPPAWWLAAVGLLVALALQTTLEPRFPIRGATVSLTLLVVVWYALRAGTWRALVLGAVAGACEDSLSGGTGAAWTIATIVVTLGVGRAHGTFVADSRLWMAPIVLAASLVRDVLFAAMLQAQGTPLGLTGAHAHAFLWQAALNAVVAIALVTWKPSLIVPDAASY